jgi:hypothetical protein
VKGNIIQTKETEFRIILQNINCLKVNSTNKWKGALERSKALEAGYIGMCETCVNWKSKLTCTIFRNILQKQERTNAMVASKIPTNDQRTYRPGSTASVSVNKWNHKI